jgi:hypothetical protein
VRRQHRHVSVLLAVAMMFAAAVLAVAMVFAAAVFAAAAKLTAFLGLAPRNGHPNPDHLPILTQMTKCRLVLVCRPVLPVGCRRM